MRQISYFFIFLSLFALSCTPDRDRTAKNKSIVTSPIQAKISNGNSNLILGDTIVLNVNQLEGFNLTDITLSVNDADEHKIHAFPFDWKSSTKDFHLGINKVRISAMGEDKVHNKTVTFTLLSNAVPKKYGYKLVNSYDHDDKAYTQGLIFVDGFLYEGTGQKGLSSLRKVDLETGKVLKKEVLDASIFGEGITLFDDKIYQLSWNSQIGFIFDRETFKEISRFYYQGEGWGITTDGINLFRSDGSNKIHVHEPVNFSLIRSIQVYSDKSAVTSLNELEFIDGKIYANVWQKDEIAIIDPITGKLEGLVNMKNLLPKKYHGGKTDVLNGIAYDNVNDRLFVTGKYWPKLFEIALTEK